MRWRDLQYASCQRLSRCSDAAQLFILRYLRKRELQLQLRRRLCVSGCDAAQCTNEPCKNVVCDQPPASSCVDAKTQRTYPISGTCGGAGVCSYAPTDVNCAHGCQSGICQPASGGGGGCSGISLTWAHNLSDWVNTNSQGIALRSISSYADGSFIAAGSIAGPVQLGSGTPQQVTLTGAQLNSGVLVRFSSDGSFASGHILVASQGGSEIAQVKGLPDGGALVYGSFAGIATFDYGAPGSVQLHPVDDESGYDVFLARIDSNDHLVWLRQIGGQDLDQPWSMDTMSDGSSVLAARVGGLGSDVTISVGQPDAVDLSLPSGKWEQVLLVKYDAAGKIKWTNLFGGSSRDDQVNDLRTLSDGSTVIVGQYQTDIQFPGQNFTGKANYTPYLFLARYLSDGSFSWARSVNDSTAIASALQVSSTGTLLITGNTGAAATFGSGESTQVSFGSGPDNAFIAEYQTSGGFLGLRAIGSGSSSLGDSAFFVTPTGDLFIGGDIYYSYTFSTSKGAQTINSTGWEDGYLACASASGPIEWIDTASGNQHEYVTAFAMSKNGDLLVVGTNSSDVSFSNGTTLPLGNLWDNTFIAKYKL